MKNPYNILNNDLENPVARDYVAHVMGLQKMMGEKHFGDYNIIGTVHNFERYVATKMNLECRKVVQGINQIVLALNIYNVLNSKSGSN